MIFLLTPTSLITLLLTIALSSGCLPSCICKWRDGKQTVECKDHGLLIIPQGIDTGTQVLDVSGNNFHYIHGEIFSLMGLINLQKLFLSRCEITVIHEDAFEGLTNLVELDLSENMLNKIPSETLLRCPSLMKLSLSKNPIRSLDRLAFNHLSFLTTLDLSGCEIIEVHGEAFSGLYSIEWIDLSLNKLHLLPNMRLFPNKLKGVQLQGNPWMCDCRILEFSEWLNRNVVPTLKPPLCREPRKFEGIPVRSLNESELACTPELVADNFYFEVEEGANLTLLCQVKSNPVAEVSWIFKGHLLHNSTDLKLNMKYLIEEGGDKAESRLIIYTLNSENNGTFYCIAENPAGVTTANYTVVITPTPTPVRLEKEPQFPKDIIPVFLTAGLILSSLCFVGIIMALIKRHTKSKRKIEGSSVPIEEQRKHVGYTKSILISKDRDKNEIILPNDINDDSKVSVINSFPNCSESNNKITQHWQPNMRPMDSFNNLEKEVKNTYKRSREKLHVEEKFNIVPKQIHFGIENVKMANDSISKKNPDLNNKPMYQTIPTLKFSTNCKSDLVGTNISTRKSLLGEDNFKTQSNPDLINVERIAKNRIRPRQNCLLNNFPSSQNGTKLLWESASSQNVSKKAQPHECVIKL